MNVLLDKAGILTAVQRHPEVCNQFWWGNRLGALSVNLQRASANIVADLLADAWEHKSPKRLAKDRTGGAPGGP